MHFSQLKGIEPELPHTFEEHCFLTFDIDWCCDAVLADTIDLVEKSDVDATWFITHDTPLLKRLRENPKFELGIHPNFNLLLDWDSRNGVSVEDVIDRLLTIVPEAVTERSHSTQQSSKLWEILSQKGLTHECNHFIPEQAGIGLKPWRLWNELIKVPYFWEDDVACLYGNHTPVQDLMSREGLKVFDFHPAHVFLNTESLDRYKRTRELQRKPDELIRHRYEGVGTRAHLENLLGLNS